MVSIIKQHTIIATALLSTIAATTNSIGFIPRRHIFATSNSVSFVDARRLMSVRGGSQDSSVDNKEDAVVPNQDVMDDVPSIEKEVDGAESTASPPDSGAWDEEIKRLQDYLNSAESRGKSSVAKDVRESTDVYGAGEDVAVLGSGVATSDDQNHHEREAENVVDVENLDSIPCEQSESLGEDELSVDQVTENSGGDTIIKKDVDEFCETNMDTIAQDQDDEYQIDGDVEEVDIDVGEVGGDVEEVDADIGEIEGNDKEHNTNTVEVASDEDELEVDMSGNAVEETNDEVLSTETAPGAEIDLEDAQEVVVDEEIITKDADKEEMRDTQIITDQHLDIIAAEESDIDVDLRTHHSAAVNEWKTPPTAAESNRLVEEGLSKLRRKDGDHPSVPYVITRAMKRVLVDELGYDEEEVKAMRADVAVVIVSENLKRPSIATLPPRFYHEDVEPMQQNDSLRDVLRNKMQSFVQKIDLKQGLAVLGAVMAYSFFIVFKRFHGEDVVLPEVIPVDESIDLGDDSKSDEPVGEDETEIQNPAISRSDFDKNWLERLISMITFFK